MNAGGEAIGDLATGTAWARAAEPAAGEAAREAHGPCLNCGTVLTGRYCHACGQSSHVHKTLMSIVHDLLHGVFHFEAKIWRTLPMLVLHPGQLTRRYIDGERARFVSPLALFLFTVFLMFAVYSTFASASMMSGIADGWNSVPDKPPQEARAELARAVAARSRMVGAHQSTAAIDRRITTLRSSASAGTGPGPAAPSGDRIVVGSKWHWLDEGLKRAKANPGLVIYKAQSAAYKFSWALIFLSTPFVALLFLWRRRFGLYDHATFVTYSISFMSLLVIALTLLGAINVPAVLLGLLLLIAPPAHMFVQLRGAYALGWFPAFWRTVVLLLVAWLILAVFIVGVIALEVAH